MRRNAALAGLLLLLLAACFAPALDNGFVDYDDDLYVTGNPHIQSGLTLPALRWAFTTFTASNWHPLTWLSHGLDVTLFGLNPRGHHATSLLLHAANTLLLFLLLLRLSGAPGKSALAAALFGIHPLHVESVAWVAERKDVLSTLFFMLTLLAYGRYAACPNLRRYVPVALLFALGLMAKPMLVSLPLLLLLLDYWPLGRLQAGAGRARLDGPPPTRRPRLLLEKLPLLVLSALSGLVTLAAQHSGGAVKSFEAFPFDQRLGNALVSAVAYLGRTLWPRDLSVFYPHPGRSLSPAAVAAAALLLAAVTALALRAARRRPYLLAGWGWYLLTLAPVLGLVQVGEQASADRYTYIPITGLFLLAIWGLADLPKRRGFGPRLPAIAAAPLLLALAAATRAQVGVWRDSVSLFEHALASTRDNFVAHDNLAVALAQRGRTREGMRHALIALRIRPDLEPARYVRFGRALLAQGMNAEALEVLETAVRMDPADPEAARLRRMALAAGGAR